MDAAGHVSRCWLTLLVLLTGCASPDRGQASPRGLAPASQPSVAGLETAGSVPPAAVSRVDVNRSSSVLVPEDWTNLESLYGVDGGPPLWTDAQGHLTVSARQALHLLRGAADDGLDPEAYRLDLLERLVRLFDGGTTTPEDVTSFDLTMSAGMLRYLRHIHIGRIDPRAIGFRLDVPPDRHDFPAVLRRAIDENRVAELTEQWRPPLRQYQQLRGALMDYRAWSRDASIAIPSVPTQAVKPGDAYAGVRELELLLARVGDVPTPRAPTQRQDLYDGALVEGVKSFQRRHGLDADGVLGSKTMAALRTPLLWRSRQIELALERLRWLPHLADGRLIVLNIPMFRLWAWDGAAPDALRFGMDVIVGRAIRTQTPVFVEEMREVIVRPYWNVPRSILRDEIVPRLERDPDYLEREQMELVRSDRDDAPPVRWSTVALRELKAGTLRVRQRPGPHNALGLIKFDFPNAEHVYMHGTPSHALFARTRRDFSHGCVRVADPVALGEWVLQDVPAWNRTRLEAAMVGTRTLRIPLPQPIPVVLFYTTAAVMPEDGALHFADDIYGHDLKLHRALIGQVQ